MGADPIERFVKVPRDILKRRDLTPAAKLVYAELANRAIPNGEAWPGIRKIAKECGISPTTAHECTVQLESVGLLVAIRAKGNPGGRTNRYRIAPGSGSVTYQKPNDQVGEHQAPQEPNTGRARNRTKRDPSYENQPTRPQCGGVDSVRNLLWEKGVRGMALKNLANDPTLTAADIESEWPSCGSANNPAAVLVKRLNDGREIRRQRQSESNKANNARRLEANRVQDALKVVKALSEPEQESAKQSLAEIAERNGDKRLAHSIRMRDATEPDIAVQIAEYVRKKNLTNLLVLDEGVASKPNPGNSLE